MNKEKYDDEKKENWRYLFFLLLNDKVFVLSSGFCLGFINIELKYSVNVLGRGGSGGSGGGGGGYGFRRQDDGEVEILKDAIFIQNLPKNITRDEIQDAFSTVGQIKVKKLFLVYFSKFFPFLLLVEWWPIRWSKNLDL